MKLPDRPLRKADREYIEANMECSARVLAHEICASVKVVEKYLNKVRADKDPERELRKVEKRILGGDISDETIRRRNALLVEIERRTPKKYRKGEGEYICPIHTI